jgi:hypothetical protein
MRAGYIGNYDASAEVCASSRRGFMTAVAGCVLAAKDAGAAYRRLRCRVGACIGAAVDMPGCFAYSVGNEVWLPLGAGCIAGAFF